MSQVAARRLAIAEPVFIFSLIMAYIWSLRFAHRWFWLGILALILASHALRRERAGELGFRLANLRECLSRFAPALAFFALLMVSAGKPLAPSGSTGLSNPGPPTSLGASSSSTC
jgi:hypothetical protein